MGMDAAVGNQTDEMQRAVVGFCVFHGTQKRLVLKEHAVPYVLGDLDQHLIDHAAGADVGMSNLGIAHLAVRQAHVKAGSADLGEAIPGLQGIDVGSALGENGIALKIVISNAEAIENEKSGSAHQ